MKPKQDKILDKAIEKQMDREFEKYGIKTRVCHFRGIYPFNGVTVVMANAKLVYSWEVIAAVIKQNAVDAKGFNPATHLLERLIKLYGLYGVAICDRRDTFSRQGGRCRAKRRLLRHLKKRE